MFKECLAKLVELDGSSLPIKKGNPDLFLQATNRFAERWLGNGEFFRRFCHMFHACDDLEIA